MPPKPLNLPDDLEGKTKADIQEIAANAGIELNGRMTKKDMISEVEKWR